jgi:outer membrane protein assembly factor BamB
MLLALALVGQQPSQASLLSPTAVNYNWLQYNGDPAHSGSNPNESLIGAANVAGLAKYYQVTLPAVADGAPAYLDSVQTPVGLRALLFITTKAGHIIALEALTGTVVWSHQVGPGSCRINNGSNPCYTTSSPAVDPSLNYVYSYGLDGYVHKYRVGDGVEAKDAAWPELVTKKGSNEKGSSALTIATASNGTSYLYMPNGGYPGDRGDYQGHITAINLATGAQQVFNALCSNQAVHFVDITAHPPTPDCPQVQTAIWSRAGVVYDARTDRIYMATGNGDFSPANHAWGDTVFALNPDGSGSNGDPLDTFTPATYQQLQNADADLGSTNLALLPPQPGLYPHLAVQCGKDQLLRLLNIDNLSGQGSIGHTGGEIGAPISVPQGGEVLTTPAVWTALNGDTWVFVVTGSGISGLKLLVDGTGHPSLSNVWTNLQGGFSPLVANGVLYYAGSSLLHALNPLTGASLWNSSLIGGIHWESPVIADGVLYITDESAHLTAYSINGLGPGESFLFFLPVITR